MTDLGGARVFITGANGFIGSHLARRLYGQGAELGFLLRPGGTTASIVDMLPGAQICSGTVSDNARLKAFLDDFRPDFVFHLAAYTGVARDLAHADDAVNTNFIGTINLLRALEGSTVRAIVASGTCEEYGDAEPPFHEDMPPRPASPYSASKAAMTSWCQMAHRLTGLPISVVRPFLCYGPGQSLNRPIPQVICTALEGRDLPMTRGTQTRDLTHVTDMVDGYLRAATTPAAIGEIINLGTGIEHRIRDVFEKIYALAGGRGRLKVGELPDRVSEVWRSVSATKKAREILGWQAGIGLDEGLAETVAWYREQNSMAVANSS